MNKIISGLIIILVLFASGCTSNYYINEADSNKQPKIQDNDNDLNPAEKTPTTKEVDKYPEIIPEQSANNNNLAEKKYTLGGIDKYQEISSEQPVKITISGVRNKIVVSQNTIVNSIVISGTDIIIILPEGSNPEITDSGIRTTITYS